MSRTVVRVSAFLVAISLALAAMRAYSDEPPKNPADDDPFGEGADAAPAVPAKPVAPRAKVPPDAKPPVDGDDPFAPGPSDSENAAPAKPAAPSAKAPPAKPAGWSPGFSRNAHARPPKGGTPARPKLHGGERAILKALKEETELDFSETPLKDVLDSLSEKHHIPIILDAAGLKDAGVEPDMPVTKKLSGISLQSALEILLDDMQLKWTIHHDVLMITSPAKAESDEFMETKIYDVTDLVIPVTDTLIRDNPLSTADAMRLDSLVRGIVPSLPLVFPGGMGGGLQTSPVVGSATMSMPGVAANIGGLPHSVPNYNYVQPAQGADFQPLMDLIENTIATKSWLDNGGNGTISDLPGPSLYLVISQTQEVHRQIKELLADSRARDRKAPAFQIELHWLWLDAAHRASLFASGGTRSANRGYSPLDPQRLSQIAREVPNFHALAHSLNGENATVAAGDRRALIVDAVAADNGGAYQPIVSMPNIGVSATVAPIMLPGTKTVRLTVRSTITRWTPARPPAIIKAAWGPESNISADASQSPEKSSSANSPPAVPQKGGGTGMGMGMGGMGMGMGGGFFQVAPENAKTAPSAAPPNAPSAPPPSASNSQEKPTQTQPPTVQSMAPATAHASVVSHGGGSTSCPIDLPVMPTQEFGTTLRVPLGKPVVVGSITFAPEGGAGVGAAKEDSVEVYLIATTSLVKKEVTPGAKGNPKSKARNPKQKGNPKAE